MPEPEIGHARRRVAAQYGITPTTVPVLAPDLTERATVHHITAATLAALHPDEREDAERLASARQALAAEHAGRPGWHELTADERASSTVEALHYLRAAERADLIRRCHCGGGA